MRKNTENRIRPGDVREAVNYRCKWCGDIFRTPQGLNGHLVKKHSIRKENITFGFDWGKTKLESTAW